MRIIALSYQDSVEVYCSASKPEHQICTIVKSLLFPEAELGWPKCSAGYHQKSCDDIKSGVGLS